MCDDILEPRYSWSADRLMLPDAHTTPDDLEDADDGTWRPELVICATDDPLSEYTIHPLSLWLAQRVLSQLEI